jgi:hypothetical protein
MTEHIIVADEDSTRTITMRRPEKKEHPDAGNVLRDERRD